MVWHTPQQRFSGEAWLSPGHLSVRCLALLFWAGLGMISMTAHAAEVDDAAPAEIPDFVMEYAPLIWVHSEDVYYPGNFADMLKHSEPQINHTVVEGAPSSHTLDNVDQLNELGGEEIFLTSKEGIRALPPWFAGVAPNPDDGKTGDATCSIIVVNDHGDGVVDAFYFYFYPYNQGNTVVGIQFGNHVGDWEHNMIRFENGEPKSIWYSQHAAGQAFTFDATEKKDGRPLGWTANGTHATYSSSGPHDHTIPGLDPPFGLLIDETDDGILWDPTLNAYTYHYNAEDETFTPYKPNTPVNWLQFDGQWGDEQLPDDWEGQINVFGQRKYTSGPNGPKFKNLVREEVCPDGVKPCVAWPFTKPE